MSKATVTETVLATRTVSDPPAEFNPTDMMGSVLKAITDQGVTPETVQAFRELAQLKREMDADEAKKAYQQAFREFQRACPRVVAEQAIPNKTGGVKYKYAPLASIVETVAEQLFAHGFSYSFDSSREGNLVCGVCTITHDAGHSVTARFAVRPGQGPVGANEAQADGAGLTSAQRRAFCLVLGIVVAPDTDARNEGETISPEEAADLERRVGMACGGDADQIGRYLKLAGAGRWNEIRRNKYEIVLTTLEQAEAKTPPPAPAAADLPPDEFFTDAARWKNGMLEVIGDRWKLTPSATADAFAKMEKAAGKSYLALSAKQRENAWKALHAGQLDAKYGPKP